MDAVPLKSALKKPGGPVVITRQQNGRQKASSPAQEKNQNSRYVLNFDLVYIYSQNNIIFSFPSLSQKAFDASD